MKSINEIINEFLSYQDVNDLSRNEYKSVINYFTRWVVINGLDFFRLKKSDILRYKAEKMADVEEKMEDPRQVQFPWWDDVKRLNE